MAAKATKRRKKGTLDYPVSTKYREGWGEWESVREIVQNAIDSGARMKVDFKNGTLTVRDWGEGFGLQNLIIGESSKDGVSTIGKFGEGMKFAFLVLLRMGCSVRVQTNGLTLSPKLKDTFDVKTLSIGYATASKSIEGTKVVVTGLKDDYRDRFLNLNKAGKSSGTGTGKWKSRVLLDQPGKLFVKGIYVKDIPSAAGYDLAVERENPMSGDVDMYSVRSKVKWLIESTKDTNYIRLLLSLIDQEGVDEFVEIESGQGSYWTMENPKTWSRMVRKHFGTVKVCRATDMKAAPLAQYKGWTVVTKQYPFLSGILKRDLQVVKLPKTEKERRVAKKNLSTTAKSDLRWAKKLVEGATGHVIKKLQVVEFLEEPTKRGEAVYGSWIKLSKKAVLGGRERLLRTLIHEMVHYLWGYDDLSHSFQEGVGKVAAQIAIYSTTSKKAKSEARRQKREEQDAKAGELRVEWCEIARRERDGLGASVKGHLHAHPKKDLHAVARAFGVKSFGVAKGPLVADIAKAVYEYLDV